MKVPPRRQILQVIILLIRASNQVGSSFNRFVGEQYRFSCVFLRVLLPVLLPINPSRPQISCGRIEQRLDLALLHGAGCGSDCAVQFCLVELMIPPHQHDDRARFRFAGSLPFFGHQRQSFDLVLRRHPQELRYVCDGLLPRCMHFQRSSIALRRQIRNRFQPRIGFLQVRRVITSIAAHNLVFARRSPHHELMRLLSSHRPRIRLHHQVLQFAPVKDAAVGGVVLLIGNVEPGGIHVERVRVLHHELAHPQQPRFGPQLVTKLGRNLIPDLRQLLVTPQFLQRNRGHDFFFRHAQRQVGALAVFQAKQVVAHQPPAPASLPNFPRMQRRQIELLPDPVHLLADNSDDLVE